MFWNVEGTRSDLGRVISAEVRARMAAQRISGKALAALAGVSQNYLATRLRDEKPFTLDDLDVLLDHIGNDEDVWTFVHTAFDRHGDNIWEEMRQLDLARREDEEPIATVHSLRRPVVSDEDETLPLVANRRDPREETEGDADGR